MEHLSTFKLSRDPFANDPQLAFYYESPVHQDAERRLERAVLQNKGLSLVTGAGGVGKTLLIRHFLEELAEEVFEPCMLIPIPGVSDGLWILDRFARQLGVEEPEADRQALMGQIYEQLSIVREDGRHTVLIFDEAQVLADQGLLGELRGLLNLEYEDRRMVSMILVGLPSLDSALKDEPALSDRVDVRIELKPLDFTYATQYLTHRIMSAGGNPAILEGAAQEVLYKMSRGVPRHLNSLADNALFEAHLAGRVSATAGDVEKAAADLQLFPEEEGDGFGLLTSGPALSLASEDDANAMTLTSSEPLVSAGSAQVETLAESLATTPAPATMAEPPSEVSDALELEEVVASDTNPLRDAAPEETLGDALPAFEFGPGAPKPAQADSPAETLGLGEGGAASDGELENLFADLVEE